MTQKGAGEQMKKKLIAFLLFAVFAWAAVLSGCTKDKPKEQPDELGSVEQVGQIPDEFKNIIANNTFYDAAAFDGRLLKTEITSKDKENRTVVQRVWMMDMYGKELAAYTCSSDDAYHISTLTATEDGGFLFVLGFSDYAYDQNTWASEKGFASRVIKIHKDGKLQFDTPFDTVEGSALRFCFEKNGLFYFFGTIQTPETKTQGVHSKTDIYMTVLDEGGTVLNTKCIAGSDYDSLNAAEATENGFLLSMDAQSDDGDFAGSDSKGYPVDWVMTVNDDLEITDKKKATGRGYFDDRVGIKDGSPIYKSDDLLKDFDGGTVTAFVDYGDSYLVVSENATGVYKNIPFAISSIWYYTETVYSLYDYSGKLLFRAFVDSSPDYDARIEALKTGNEGAPGLPHSDN